MLGQLLLERAKMLGREIGTQELHSVGVGQVEFRIAIKPRQPRTPVSFLQQAQKIIQLVDCRLRMVLHRLPEMFRGVVSSSIELNAFGDRIPIGKYPSRHRRRCAPAIQGMLPLPAHSEECLSVPCRNWLLPIRQRSPYLVWGGGKQSFEGALVNHRYTPAPPPPP